MSENNPNDTYRSYQPMKVYNGEGQDVVAPGVTHERVSHQEMITRANGGTTNMDQMYDLNGNLQSDGK